MAAGRLAREVPAHHEERGVSRPPDHISGITSRPVVVCSRNPTGFFGPRSQRRPLSATQHHPATSLVGISWHCKEPYKLMASILTISVTTTHCISITYKPIFISMTYKNVKKIK